MDLISIFDLDKETLCDYLINVHNGNTQIPDLQRSFCWSDEQIRKLLASISLGWPIQSILLLTTGNSTIKFKPRLLEGVTLEQMPEAKSLILDGQQRSTGLYMALYSANPVWIREKKNKKIQQRWYYIDIELALDADVQREEAIISLPISRIKHGQGGTINCSTPEHEFEMLMFPMSQVFRYASWRAAFSKYWQYDSYKLELIDRFEEVVIKKFEHYQIPVIKLRPELSKAAVCQVFEKVNTISTELNFFDLTTAMFASEDFSLRDDFEDIYEKLRKFSILAGLRDMDWLQAVTLVASYYRRQDAMKSNSQLSKPPSVACSRKEILNLTLQEYQKYADITRQGYEEAARFLHGLRILLPEDIAYPIQLVALAGILSIKGFPNELRRSKLEQWWWCGMFGEMYTGWHDTRSAKDMLEVPEWLEGGKQPSTLEVASFAKHRLLAPCRRHGAVYKAFNALLRQHGAIDFASGEELGDLQFFNDAIESHHIFPEAWCKSQGIDVSRYNGLVNRTPLSETTNRLIGGKAPSEYLTKLVKEQGISKKRLDVILRSHLIPSETLWNDDFDKFIDMRTQALLELINNAMGKPLANPLESLAESLSNSKDKFSEVKSAFAVLPSPQNS